MIVTLVKINNSEDLRFWNNKILSQGLLQTKKSLHKHSKYLNIGLYVEIKKLVACKIKMNINQKIAIRIIWDRQFNELEDLFKYNFQIFRLKMRPILF